MESGPTVLSHSCMKVGVAIYLCFSVAMIIGNFEFGILICLCRCLVSAKSTIFFVNVNPCKEETIIEYYQPT